MKIIHQFWHVQSRNSAILLNILNVVLFDILFKYKNRWVVCGLVTIFTMIRSQVVSKVHFTPISVVTLRHQRCYDYECCLDPADSHSLALQLSYGYHLYLLWHMVSRIQERKMILIGFKGEGKGRKNFMWWPDCLCLCLYSLCLLYFRIQWGKKGYSKDM